MQKCPKCNSIKLITVRAKGTKDYNEEEIQCLRCNYKWVESAYYTIKR
jgi:DNA-directed RNA polymerase subunit M/transcription elongation factor TFIIS